MPTDADVIVAKDGVALANSDSAEDVVDFIVSVGWSTVGVIECGQGGAGGKGSFFVNVGSFLVNVVAVLVVDDEDVGSFSVLGGKRCVEIFVSAEWEGLLSTIS